MKSVMTRQILLTVLSAVLIPTLPAHADEWTKTYTLSGRPDLHIETSDANIRVTSWDQNTIEAKVITTHYKIGEGGIRIDERQTGNSVDIEVHYPHNGFNIGWGNHRVDIIIQMPHDGDVNLRTGDGKIEVAGLRGQMDLHSGDGGENLDHVDGKLHATTGDGHIRAAGRFDELELKTGDGHVEVRAESGSKLAANWRIETGDGSASVELPSDLPADLDFHTNDGRIDLDMPVAAEGQVRENEIRGKLNGGGNRITVRTGDGSIHLGKS